MRSKPLSVFLVVDLKTAGILGIKGKLLLDRCKKSLSSN